MLTLVRPRRATAGRIGLAAIIVACGVLIMLAEGPVRRLETVWAGRLTGDLTGTQTLPMPRLHTFYWIVSPTKVGAIDITSACTAAFLVGPFLVAAGILLLSRRFRVPRMLIGVLVAAALLFGANLARLALVGWATRNWGINNGYVWAHSIAGTYITLIAVAAAVALLVLAARERKPAVAATAG